MLVIQGKGKICVDGVEPLHVIGNGHFREIEYQVPEWGVDEETCFRYKGDYFYLSEFTHAPEFLKELGFHGVRTDSFFSGLLVKLSDCGDGVQVYRYYS